VEIATLSLVGTLLLTMLYLAYQIGGIKNSIKNIEKRLNDLEHLFRQFIRREGG